MPRDAELDAVLALNLTTPAVLASLISELIRKGILTTADAREIYERALLLIETAQTSSPHSQHVFAAARELIEQHLRAPKPPL